MSLNHCYVFSTIGKIVRRFPSKKYKQYESEVNNLLRAYKKEITKLNNYFDEEKHYLVCNYQFYYPILTKKEKKVSKKSIDLSNAIKALEDIVFKNLVIDDSAVCSLYVDKIHSENIRCDINIKVKDIKFIQ